ncbi:MAG TPA: hypothetical protein VFS66_10140 [Acidimicrobiia bacterium]|nr:hypothetical protein [Acidimicrobiia bacterium]
MRSPDPVLSLVGAVGLAAAGGTGLVIDLLTDRAGGKRTLRDLAVDGPSLAELSPSRRGVALLRGGGIEEQAALEIIERLAQRWPAVTIRVDSGRLPFPVVPAIPLYPPGLLPAPSETHCVWQPVGVGSDPPGPGPVLPRLRPSTLRRLLTLQMPRRSRWVEAWAPVWEMPWA